MWMSTNEEIRMPHGNSTAVISRLKVIKFITKFFDDQMKASDKPTDGKQGYDADRDVDWVKKTGESEELYLKFKTGKLNDQLFSFLVVSAYECARYRALFPGQVLPVYDIIQKDTDEFVEANDVVGHFAATS